MQHDQEVLYLYLLYYCAMAPPRAYPKFYPCSALSIRRGSTVVSTSSLTSLLLGLKENKDLARSGISLGEG